MIRDRQSIIDAATKMQQHASSPMHSVWVSANAGTGKTRVLTNRILRLLIDGAKVNDILAVTYTRAAAAEMRNRLYDRLADWAVTDTTSLTKNIQDMGVERPSQKQISRARRLFAELLDAPIPIRIETVHAFSQSVLRRFPVEANVQPYFDVATDSQTQSLKDEAVADAMASGDPLVVQSIRLLAQLMNEDQLVKAASALFEYPEVLAAVNEKPAEVKRQIYQALNCLDAADGPDAALLKLAEPLTQTEPHRDGQLKAYHDACLGGSKSDQKRAKTLARFYHADQDGRLRQLDNYVGLYLTQKGEISSRLATKKTREAHPFIDDFEDSESQLALEYRKRSIAIKTAQQTMAIYVVAAQMDQGYSQRKMTAGLMDYNDLIAKTVTLFNEGGVSWVRYKLDKGIQHLLIDEAQDTSPDQWKILSSLAEEFFQQNEDNQPSGAGDKPARTLFSVGDYKQSIYSFQGARPDLFHQQKDRFAGLAKRNQKPFAEVNLDTSFRTTSPVLSLVDRVTRGSNPDQEDFLEGLGEAAAHGISRSQDAGFVEVLDVISSDIDDPLEPYTPHRGDDTTSAEVLLAEKIVEVLSSWIGKRELPARGRVMRAGDILILVRQRDRFSTLLDRAIRRAGLPLAGSDRIKLTEEIAVMDLLALGQVMLLPEDDLNLAAVLKSPLFNMTEDELFELAHDRGESTLIQNLASKAEINPRFTSLHDQFNQWLGLAEVMTPYDFFRAVLTSDKRQDFTRRMGAPVLDVLQEFLETARNFEDTQAPSMQGFLAMLAVSEIAIKRESNTADDDEIRIMTIHGAKGLEAPVVILPDTLKRIHSVTGQVVDLTERSDRLPIKPLSNAVPPFPVALAKAHEKQLSQEEDHRLLYVGLTRAQDGLLVAGYEKPSSRKLDGSWYERIRNALESMDDHAPRPSGDGIMIASQQSIAPEASQKPRPKAAEYEVPDWLFSDAAPEETPPRPLSPSRFGGEYLGSSPTGQSRKKAMLRGSLTHRFLEVLPNLTDDQQQRAMARILAPIVPAHLDQETADLAVAETLRLINDVTLRDIFGEASRAEVPVSGMVGSHIINGVIDRLLITDDKITIIDFKTGQPPEDELPPSYVTQLALYAHVISEIWTGRHIEAGLIYTEDASLHWLKSDQMATAISPLL